MQYRVTVLPQNRIITAQSGQSLQSCLRQAGFSDDAPCGGNGTCGKCKCLIDGKEVLACQTLVTRDLVVTLPQESALNILTDSAFADFAPDEGLCLALDIGTTIVAAYLVQNGQVLRVGSRKNPQSVFGADVVSRLHQASKGHDKELTDLIRRCVQELTEELLQCTGKTNLDRICVVGNPAMQQLFLGLPTENLTKIPFKALLQKTQTAQGGTYIPAWSGAALLTVPDISGYIGADTVACVLASSMDKAEKLTLLVDIGTNGEMVLGNKDRLVACATAAGPALEGAFIKFGMQASKGAIDRVNKDFSCHVIGGGQATGICGSGLLDAAAAALDQGLLNERGRILNDSRTLPLTENIYLTQEDIRQLQQAKGAIAAGIHLMAQHLGIQLTDIEQVYLAGAFGTFLDPRSACRIGLLPAQLEDKCVAVGNAAGSGAVQMVCSKEAFLRADQIVAATEHLDLATLPDWSKTFARQMHFENTAQYLCKKALSLGFSAAVPLEPGKLQPRQDVRAMCAADKCGAYGKNWTCPPHCGTLDQCTDGLQRYSRGILVQTVGQLSKAIDTKGYRKAEQQHLKQFYALADAVRSVHPQALCLGSGGCRICEKCAYPEPCRFPEKACSSMEAYGLFVTQVCRDHDLSYHHGEKTVTYTGCILF
jgi:uncharacterized 2Fe-2S/4Fe-4S cluster protein (DUF4445 family)